MFVSISINFLSAKEGSHTGIMAKQLSSSSFFVRRNHHKRRYLDATKLQSFPRALLKKRKVPRGKYPPGNESIFPPKGKFGKSSTQKCWLGGDMLATQAGNSYLICVSILFHGKFIDIWVRWWGTVSFSFRLVSTGFRMNVPVTVWAVHSTTLASSAGCFVHPFLWVMSNLTKTTGFPLTPSSVALGFPTLCQKSRVFFRENISVSRSWFQQVRLKWAVSIKTLVGWVL